MSTSDNTTTLKIELGEISEIRRQISKLRNDMGHWRTSTVGADDLEIVLDICERLANLLNAIALKD